MNNDIEFERALFAMAFRKNKPGLLRENSMFICTTFPDHFKGWLLAKEAAMAAPQQEPVAIPEATQEQIEALDDLVTMVRRLVHALHKAAPTAYLSAWASDYLERKGFNKGPFREACSPLPPAAQVSLNGDKAFDDDAVDQFASAMKEKLDKKRFQGRAGWHDKKICSQKQLSNMLFNHVDKGDPLDVGNFAMMLFFRQEKIIPLPDPVKPSPNGYAYEYPGPYGGIQFTHGGERNGSKPLRSIPYYFDAPPPAAPALSDEEIDALIDKILCAAGSGLRHYSMQKSKDDMRSAMRCALLAKETK